MDAITQYIMVLLPSITSIIGMVVLVITFFAKVKKLKNSIAELLEKDKDEKKELEAELAASYKKNAELSKVLAALMNKLQHIHFIDKEE